MSQAQQQSMEKLNCPQSCEVWDEVSHAYVVSGRLNRLLLTIKTFKMQSCGIQ